MLRCQQRKNRHNCNGKNGAVPVNCEPPDAVIRHAEENKRIRMFKPKNVNTLTCRCICLWWCQHELPLLLAGVVTGWSPVALCWMSLVVCMCVQVVCRQVIKLRLHVELIHRVLACGVKSYICNSLGMLKLPYRLHFLKKNAFTHT